MDSLEFGLLVVISINVMLVMGQISAEKINPGFAGSLVDCKNSPMGQYGNCTTGHYSIDTSAPSLPTSATSVDATTGGVFTDLYNTVKNWFGSIPGVKFVTGLVGAPASFLKGMNLDPDFANLIGGAWWVITTMMIVTYLKR